MTTPITKEPLYAEVHNVPDDYHFTGAELECIIAGDMFTPLQGAIMAREIQERRKAAMDAEPVADVVAWHKEGEERTCDIRWRRFDVAPGPLFAVAQPGVTADADDNFYSWFGREWHEHYQQNQYTTAAKQMLGVMAESAWNACRAAMLQAGNSPAIPDGYVVVPVEPTKEMIDSGWLHFMGTKNPSSKGTYKAMLAAAPQQEVKP